jgi:hypothetical protein
MGLSKKRGQTIRKCVLERKRYLSRGDTPRLSSNMNSKRRWMVKWIESQTSKYGQAMPDKQAVHMPPGMTKQQIYTWYCAAWARHRKGGEDWQDMELSAALRASRESSITTRVGGRADNDIGAPAATTALRGTSTSSKPPPSEDRSVDPYRYRICCPIYLC